MDGLHPTATALARANQEYKMALANVAKLRKARDDRRREHRIAIATAINNDPTATNVDLAALFGVTEGTVRNIRNTQPERETP